MFIEKEDLYTAICEYQLQNITTSAVTIRMAILAAIDEARSYLNAKYDCEAIFSATEKTVTPRFWSTARISRCGTYAAGRTPI